MDYNDPSRRQYAQNLYGGQGGQQQQQHPQQQQQVPGLLPGQYPMAGSDGRFRQSSNIQPAPTEQIPTAARAGSDSQLYSFAQVPQYGGPALTQTMQYGGMQAPGPQDSQQYPPYGANTIYGLPSAQVPTQQPMQHNAYEQMPQYGGQRSASSASEPFTPQFGGQQNPGFYMAGQTNPPSTGAGEMAAPPLPAGYAAGPYVPQGPSSAQIYGGGMPDPSQAAVYPSYAAAQPSNVTQSVDQSSFADYQTQIRSIFTHARDGTLAQVDGLLLTVSRYLLGNVEQLGLTRDDEKLHDDRIRFWDEFNKAWLVTLQKQFDLTREMLEAQALQGGQSIMDPRTLENLAQEIVRLCDDVERHGLVDFQMGVAEEEIVDLLLRCLSLLQPISVTAGDTGAQGASSSGTAWRVRR